MNSRIALSCAVALLGLALAGERGAAQAPYRYEYATKVLCGTLDTLMSKLVPQPYATAINVHNPNDSTVIFFKKLALTVPPGRQRPGRIVRITVDSLQPDQALVIDCLDLRRPAGVASFEGFVVLQSPMSIDVTAIYTVRGGIDVEQIRERVRSAR